MVRTRRRWIWPDVRRWLIDPASGRWQPPTADRITLFNMAPRQHDPQPLDPTVNA
jgi:hypothetical protein